MAVKTRKNKTVKEKEAENAKVLKLMQGGMLMTQASREVFGNSPIEAFKRFDTDESFRNEIMLLMKMQINIAENTIFARLVKENEQADNLNVDIKTTRWFAERRIPKYMKDIEEHGMRYLPITDEQIKRLQDKYAGDSK